MANERSLFWLLGALGINRLCSLAPSYVYFDPFPFYDITDYRGTQTGITVQAYIYGISNHAVVMCLIHLLYSFSGVKYYALFGMFFIIEVASLVDYLLIYEHPIFYINGYGFEFTDVKLIAYTLLIISWKIR